MSSNQVFEAQAAATHMLLAKSNVVGVAVGLKESEGRLTDEIAIVALVERKKPLAALTAFDIIPKLIDGFRTDVFEVGQLEAYQTPRDRFRPAVPVGVSMGHFKVTAGTLGAVVRDRVSGERFLLSNNHVFANSNEAAAGDAILQPGPIDGGQNPGDVLARLERFVPLRYVEEANQPPPSQPPPSPPPSQPPSGQGCDVVGFFAALTNLIAKLNGSDKRVTLTQGAQAAAQSAATSFDASARMSEAQVATIPDNLVDCALARPLDASMFSGDIRNIGRVTGTKPATLGMRVKKSGRTTDYTEGIVTLLNATVSVGYSTSAGKRTARFVGQVICQPMSQGGDSGSLVVDVTDNRAVGLLFAGSPAATIFTPIDLVLDTLNVSLI
ncbi:MAG: hypothetical protein HXY40_10615 [Chloroflexi bacterium]|nr:hypothetical protein [Chloroflexota bacterium]